MDAVQDFLLTPPSAGETRSDRRARVDPRSASTRDQAAILVAMGEMLRRFAPVTDANRAEATVFLKRRHQELLEGWPPLDTPRPRG